MVLLLFSSLDCVVLVLGCVFLDDVLGGIWVMWHLANGVCDLSWICSHRCGGVIRRQRDTLFGKFRYVSNRNPSIVHIPFHLLSNLCEIANERTFLGWLRMAITLGGVSSAILGWKVSIEFSPHRKCEICRNRMKMKRIRKMRSYWYLCPLSERFTLACCLFRFWSYSMQRLFFTFEGNVWRRKEWVFGHILDRIWGVTCRWRTFTMISTVQWWSHRWWLQF